MTIVESIKCVLQNNHSGLTSKQIYDEIIRRGLYIFGAENPVGVVNAQLRRRCAGLDFPTAYPVKFFEIAGYEGKKIKFRLLSEEKEVATITAPKIPDSSVYFWKWGTEKIKILAWLLAVHTMVASMVLSAKTN